LDDVVVGDQCCAAAETKSGHKLIVKVDDHCPRLTGHSSDAAGVAVDERLLLSWTTGLHLDRG
jgi:hypothetical protein